MKLQTLAVAVSLALGASLMAACDRGADRPAGSGSTSGGMSSPSSPSSPSGSSSSRSTSPSTPAAPATPAPSSPSSSSSSSSDQAGTGASSDPAKKSQ